MSLVKVSTALALGFAAFALSTPASAVTVKKQPVAKHRVAVASPAKAALPAKKMAAVAGAKKAGVVAPAKKVANLKGHRATVTAATVKPATIVKHRRVASLTPSVNVNTQSPDEVRMVPQQTTMTASAKPSAGARMPHLFASGDPVSEARRWIGTNPTDRNSLWCARFMNFVLERSGYSGTGSDAAKSFASYGQRVSGPQIGAIAVMTRGKNGGHVGIVSGIDASGNPIIISGNHGHQVGEGVYPRTRVYAYVIPR